MSILRNLAFERRPIEADVSAQGVTSTVCRGNHLDSVEYSLEVTLLVMTRKQFQGSFWRFCVGQRWVSAWVEIAGEMVPEIGFHLCGHVN